MAWNAMKQKNLIISKDYNLIILIIIIIVVTMSIDFPSYHFFVFHAHIYWSLKTKVWCDLFSKALKMVQPWQICWKNEVNLKIQ
jgi:hypothetical protein